MREMAEAILLPEPDLWDRCRRLQERYALHLWDGLIVAACLASGVETLYSEDLAGLGEVEGLKIVNPFADPSAP
jgi:predicted nucleic acid-binding protein